MNSPQHGRTGNADRTANALSPAEETLRMLAGVPAPDGLASRVQASLRTAPQRTQRFSLGGVFGFSGWLHGAAMRTAAAAAIVCVVAGGGWGVYSHVQTSPGMQGVAVPVHVNTGNSGDGGFSTSDAIAKPDPLKAPVVTRQVHPIANALPKPPQKKKPVHPPATQRP